MPNLSQGIFIGFIEKNFFYNASKNKILTAFGFFGSSLVLFLTAFILNKNFDFNFLLNPFFWIILFLELFFVISSLKNFNIQKTYAEISFILFNSIWLSAVLGVLYGKIFGIPSYLPFEAKKTVLLGTALFFTSLLYFYNTKVHNWFWLFLLLFTTANLAFLCPFVFKKYPHESLLIYGVINFIIGLIYLIFGKFKIKKTFEDLKNAKITFSLFLFWFMDLLVYFLAQKTSPVFLIYSKRIGQFSTGKFVLDKDYSSKTFLVFFLLILTFVVFFAF